MTNEKIPQIIRLVILAAVLFAFTWFGFISKQDCDIDKIYLWCRLHPMSIADWIGSIMFYLGAVFISGILPFRLSNPENSARWNYILFAAMALSIILIWSL